MLIFLSFVNYLLIARMPMDFGTLAKIIYFVTKRKKSSCNEKTRVINSKLRPIQIVCVQNKLQTLSRIVFALEARLIRSDPLFADFLSCCFFFFCFFFVTFGLPESDETSSDVVLSQKASRRHDRPAFAFAGIQVVATVSTPRNFRRGSSFRCGLFGGVPDAARSFNEPASIVR